MRQVRKPRGWVDQLRGRAAMGVSRLLCRLVLLVPVAPVSGFDGHGAAKVKTTLKQCVWLCAATRRAASPSSRSNSRSPSACGASRMSTNRSRPGSC